MSQVAYLPVGKREQTKVQNRQAILDAAREVFGELGYEADYDAPPARAPRARTQTFAAAGNTALAADDDWTEF